MTKKYTGFNNAYQKKRKRVTHIVVVLCTRFLDRMLTRAGYNPPRGGTTTCM